MKCHQRVIRDKKAETAHTENLFGNWWDKEVIDIKTAVLKQIDLVTAASVIREYEYLGTMPNAPMFSYGIFFNGNLGGCCVFGAVSPPNVARSVVPPEMSDKVLQLSRGACVHWAHEHSASKLISYSLSMIEKNTKYRVVIAYSDPDAGEIGTVYQATNWMYCGMTSKRPDYIRPDGKRSVGHIPKGVCSSWEKVDRTRKHRYVFVLGSKKERKEYKKLILWPEGKYPKRQEVN